MHWIAGRPPAQRFACSAQTRYRQPEQACEVELQDDGRAMIRFREPQRAVTPGQYAVLYQGDTCLGGAVIESTLPAQPGMAAPADRAAAG